jgi:hypothetical protein
MKCGLQRIRKFRVRKQFRQLLIVYKYHFVDCLLAARSNDVEFCQRLVPGQPAVSEGRKIQ